VPYKQAVISHLSTKSNPTGCGRTQKTTEWLKTEKKSKFLHNCTCWYLPIFTYTYRHSWTMQPRSHILTGFMRYEPLSGLSSTSPTQKREEERNRWYGKGATHRDSQTHGLSWRASSEKCLKLTSISANFKSPYKFILRSNHPKVQIDV
jgi:hypothetical protein